MENSIEIKPGIGFGELKFGATRQEVEKILGVPQETENIDVEGEIHEVEVWNYWEEGHAVYFEKELDTVATNFETDNQAATLFGVKVFELDQQGIVSLMKKNGFTDPEVEEDDELEEMIVFFEDAHLQFVFEDGKLGLVSWAVAMDDQDQVMWPE